MWGLQRIIYKIMGIELNPESPSIPIPNTL